MPAPISFARIFRAAILLSLLAGTTVAFGEISSAQAPSDEATDPALVRVSIISEFRGPKGMVELNGKVIHDYSPIVIQDFSSVGIVLDDKGHVMTFLGYRWVDIQSDKPRIEIATSTGKKFPGKLVGIDQRSGVAVIQATEGKLDVTQVCESCEGRDGAIVMVPTTREEDAPRFGERRVVAGVNGNGNGMGTAASGTPTPGAFRLPMREPLADISLPVLSRDLKVIGLLTGQDSMDAGVVYPIKPLLDSARQVLKTGGDIRAGWLGIMLQDASSGVVVQGVEPGSPAEAAGLRTRDFLLRYNSRLIESARQFIDLVETTAIGSKAKIDIDRQGTPMSVTAKIQTRQAQASLGRLSLNSPRPLIGLDTVVMTPDLADALQMPDQTGLLVIGVVPDTPAAAAGVLEGDVIIAMDGQAIFDAASFASYWQSHGISSRLVLQVLRKGKNRTISVKIRS
ncbi:MAG: PDZ domain-containing protein [Acidobacteriota bacterium]|jgi:S1-C subfamily serine protease|nr:PDZ domain-containing protein [Acidobacteriota bacterium]